MTEGFVEPGEEGPVTVQVSRRVRPGREADYEAWLHGIVEAAKDFPGHMGVNILKPSGKTGGGYVLIYRFDSFAHCEAWENSSARAGYVALLGDLVEGETERRRVTGLEAWFELPELPVTKPAPRWKMSIVLVAVVFVLVYPLQLIVPPLVPDWPHWAKTLTIAIIQVLAMTYVVMPRVTRALKSWLFAG
ncbi:antibiotic biosynthesis monooxygenase [Martelella lutilitoris]|uniref:Antibiotic biosynthesis monooxygenase n=1 Tax=Martelella lutilitoris TaxID=2583532 RepID=A0A7T7HGR5_9HYPH|nr:antibiotic biosynthesis monooxygenase [Martelella lutilitoris]QQM28899.1 antibiotic biosynthesis monooxygenase [Martelella lutilitoris]